MTDLGIAGVGDATLIASGGSALVYQALSDTGEALAVKVLRGIRGDEVGRRFERERSAAERLGGHPNIITIHHSGITAAGEPYLVMPLVAAGSLQDELDRDGPFALNRAIADVSTACEAIEFAHGRGVLHRDIKPANLLRGDDDSVIVTDFGIARVTNAGITSATVGATTPLYAAPELLAENVVSVHSEVYSLGALLYTLLAGQAAFADSDNIWASMHRIRTEMPQPIAGVPLPVMRVIEHAMAKSPIDRPASAGALLSLLNEAMVADDSWSPPRPTGTTELPRDGAVLAQARRPSEAPPAPALGRRTPPPRPASLDHRTIEVPQPARESGTGKVIASLVAVVALAALGWWATTQLFDRGSLSADPGQAPVDNSLPSPTTDPNGSSDNTGNDDNNPAPSPTPFTRLVSFSGDHFSAFLPEGWALESRDVDQGYGFRSSFVSDTMYLKVDTTPREQRAPGLEIGDSARDIAASINSASAVRTEEIEGLEMHSFTFRNREGIDSIDIFFEVDGDGYAILAGSRTDPTAAFAVARLVALSIRSNPDQ